MTAIDRAGRRFQCGICNATWASLDDLINHVWLARIGALSYCGNPWWRERDA